MTDEDYKKVAHTISDEPGVYRFKDVDGKILYIGKAKNLKKRIASYFGSTTGMAYRTRVMVKNADHFEFTIVETEEDALLLENTLIKKFQPRYNVLLKDGKSYSYICIKKERFPRVMIVRIPTKDGSTYFGPYTSRGRLKVILELIKNLFPLRNCVYHLSEQNIEAGKFKVCLQYHIKNCLGACEGLEDEALYNEKIKQIKNILRGNFGPVKTHFKELMKVHAENMEFEKAQDIKEKLTAFEDYQGKSTVVSTTITDVDVFSIEKDEKFAFVNYIKVVNGAFINTYTLEMLQNLDNEEEDLLAIAILHLREKFNSQAPEIVVPFRVPFKEDEVKITVPKIGEKKKLLELSEKNVKYFMLQKKKEAIAHVNKQTTTEKVMNIMKEDLQMDKLPLHIECFDNSNLGGSYPVASCVVFRNGKPYKKDYRHYNIKTVVGPDDFASMEEIVRRRYTRLLKEEKALPDLIIIDGGKGQLSSAAKILTELGILDKITVIGIAKKLEEIFFPGDPVPLHINKKSPSLKIIQQARNEAHRFAITFHRNKRSKDFVKSELHEIKGIGEKTADKLLRHFKSVSKIKEASFEEISGVVGKSAAKKVLEYFSG